MIVESGDFSGRKSPLVKTELIELPVTSEAIGEWIRERRINLDSRSSRKIPIPNRYEPKREENTHPLEDTMPGKRII